MRNEALLVGLVVSNAVPNPELPQSDAYVGDPMPWFETIVAAKHDDPAQVVTLGLIPNGEVSATACPEYPVPDVFMTPIFNDFVDAFGARGLIGSACQTSYAEFFDEAVSLIGAACGGAR